jgi:hypothetical protein
LSEPISSASAATSCVFVIGFAIFISNLPELWGLMPESLPDVVYQHND